MRIKVACTTKHAFTVYTDSPRAFGACIRISYDDKPPPIPPRAMLFSLSSWSAVTFMR